MFQKLKKKKTTGNMYFERPLRSSVSRAVGLNGEEDVVRHQVSRGLTLSSVTPAPTNL